MRPSLSTPRYRALLPSTVPPVRVVIMLVALLSILLATPSAHALTSTNPP